MTKHLKNKIKRLVKMENFLFMAMSGRPHDPSKQETQVKVLLKLEKQMPSMSSKNIPFTKLKKN